jgi:hypothetical protein
MARPEPPGRARPFLVGWRPSSSDARVASARIRCLNPLRELRRQDYPVELFDPVRRDSYSAVIYSKVYDRASQAEARRLQANGTRIVLDLCDNHLYNPLNLDVLRAAAGELRRMIALADEIVASTEAMAELLGGETGAGKPLTVIGDAVETRIEGVRSTIAERWWARRRLHALAARLRADPGAIRLVWFGSHGGPSGDHGMGDLEMMRETLVALHREQPLSLTVISNSARKFARLIRPWDLPTHYLEWSAETFLEALGLHAIAILPVGNNPFTRCKTNNRVATSLAAGLAVVASGIPSYRPFEECCVLDDLGGGLRRYIRDPQTRREDVAAGQRLVQREWTVTAIADQWRRYFERLRLGVSAR